ncbi:GAF domain-containing protein [Mucilaginibacter limnophilus]|uniref:histidine kinase n=1 Tax=Mucilaginibacter limnophilus TaxID=1932778 RepID=A0A3S2VMD6_9SPHI|nr:ATP-binding protein [Mucilaginibacter limnophilus]RVU00686.1 GAF domain-containing protein [Mucilaginibacter limnophilus]
MTQQPIARNEMQRIIELSEFDLDYSSLQDQFKDLTALAAKVAGTHISLVNLIDSFTSWTISNHGLPVEQLPREEAVCQYTITEDEKFEVTDLSADERFKDKSYVAGDPRLRYYFGVPLKTPSGNAIGTLCVFDTQSKPLTPEKIEMLKIIAGEIVNRLQAYKIIQQLKQNATEAIESKKRVAHDIRGPIGGIIGLARVISEQGDENNMEEVLEFINLIYKSGNSILELADEILSADMKSAVSVKPGLNELNQLVLKDRLEKLYLPQALNKNIDFKVTTNSETEVIPFSKNKLLQIIGNLISNSMKFTPPNGKVTVDISLHIGGIINELNFTVSDTGIGMTDDRVTSILNGQGTSTNGTSGEQGYGFGLSLVKHLVDSLKGEMHISSEPGKGTIFRIAIPQNKII